MDPEIFSFARDCLAPRLASLYHDEQLQQQRHHHHHHQQQQHQQQRRAASGLARELGFKIVLTLLDAATDNENENENDNGGGGGVGGGEGVEALLSLLHSHGVIEAAVRAVSPDDDDSNNNNNNNSDNNNNNNSDNGTEGKESGNSSGRDSAEENTPSVHAISILRLVVETLAAGPLPTPHARPALTLRALCEPRALALPRRVAAAVARCTALGFGGVCLPPLLSILYEILYAAFTAVRETKRGAGRGRGGVGGRERGGGGGEGAERALRMAQPLLACAPVLLSPAVLCPGAESGGGDAELGSQAVLLMAQVRLRITRSLRVEFSCECEVER